MTCTTQLCKISITSLMKVGLQLTWPLVHVICGNYVLYKHTPFSSTGWSQSRLFLLLQRQVERVLTNISRKTDRCFGLYPLNSSTETSLSFYNSFLILQSSLLLSENEKCRGLQCTAISSLPLHPGGQVHQDAQDLPDLLQDQKNLQDHALLGHPRKIPLGYKLRGGTAIVREG